jgi:hypothetical protein
VLISLPVEADGLKHLAELLDKTLSYGRGRSGMHLFESLRPPTHVCVVELVAIQTLGFETGVVYHCFHFSDSKRCIEHPGGPRTEMSVRN